MPVDRWLCDSKRYHRTRFIPVHADVWALGRGQFGYTGYIGDWKSRCAARGIPSILAHML